MEAKIPELPKEVFYNRVYEGKPVALDNKDYTLKARYELAKVANQIWPVTNLGEIEDIIYAKNKDKKKGIFKGW